MKKARKQESSRLRLNSTAGQKALCVLKLQLTLRPVCRVSVIPMSRLHPRSSVKKLMQESFHCDRADETLTLTCRGAFQSLGGALRLFDPVPAASDMAALGNASAGIPGHFLHQSFLLPVLLCCSGRLVQKEGRCTSMYLGTLYLPPAMSCTTCAWRGKHTVPSTQYLPSTT